MGLFSNILEKLGLGKKAPAAAAGAAAASAQKPAAKSDAAPKNTLNYTSYAPASTSASTPASAKPAPAPVSEVDVVKKLEQMAAGSGLDWKVSIVDLLKVLGIDSSREARNELAKELGCPQELMSDSAKMNTWLHKTVLKKIAENGGNIPASLLD